MLAALTLSGAPEIRLLPSGELRLDEFEGADRYWVEWVDQLGEPWQPFSAPYETLNAIDASGHGVQQMNLPMDADQRFFRVVAELLPLQPADDVLEAEAYSNMSGVQLEPGNTAIGWFDAGDWLRFGQVDFGSGMRSVTLNVAKGSASAGAVTLRLGQPDGPGIGRFVPEQTSGWNDYREQSLSIEMTSGVHDLYLVAEGDSGVCNIDWLRFSETALHTPDYQLVWEDEFGGDSLDTSKWSAVYHGDVDNNELQFYTDRPENIEVSGGMLRLTAIRETFTGQGPWMDQPRTSDYTSGKIESLGKAEFQYGRIEARIRMPRGEGTWPAFWMLGSNLFDTGVGWPRSGEIDIMEHPNVQDTYTAAIHTEVYNHTIGTQRVGSIPISTYDTQFHVYGVEWTADELAFYLDDTVFFTVRKSELGDGQAEWPFDQPFWLILNLAVGGPYGGDPTNGDYPYAMEVDWVRVYQDQRLKSRLSF